MEFIKMQGAGNDYIFVDCSDIDVTDKGGLAARMSDRHFGIGGDGAVFLYPSFVADVKMRMFNADGSEGNICGNALRCIGRLLLSRTGGTEFSVETNVGVRTVRYSKEDDLFTVDMGVPSFELMRRLFVCGRTLEYAFVDMGNPHCVIFVPSLGSVDMNLAEAIEHHSFFPGGINVEFACVSSETQVKVGFWERGSGETLACGSGACAVAVACFESGKTGRNVVIEAAGGKLKVNYNGSVFLTGEAVKICQGEYYDKIHFCDGRRS